MNDYPDMLSIELENAEFYGPRDGAFFEYLFGGILSFMSNGSTASSEATYLSFLDDLTALREVVGRVRDRLVLLAPAKHGSYLSLVQETAEAMRESQEGKGKMFTSAEEAVEDLERLTQSYAGKKAAKV